MRNYLKPPHSRILNIHITKHTDIYFVNMFFSLLILPLLPHIQMCSVFGFSECHPGDSRLHREVLRGNWGMTEGAAQVH